VELTGGGNQICGASVETIKVVLDATDGLEVHDEDTLAHALHPRLTVL